MQAFNRLGDVHPHWGRPTALLSSLTHMLISSRNTPQIHPKIMFNQISGHPVADTNRHIKLTAAVFFRPFHFGGPNTPILISPAQWDCNSSGYLSFLAPAFCLAFLPLGLCYLYIGEWLIRKMVQTYWADSSVPLFFPRAWPLLSRLT